MDWSTQYDGLGQSHYNTAKRLNPWWLCNVGGDRPWRFTANEIWCLLMCTRWWFIIWSPYSVLHFIILPLSLSALPQVLHLSLVICKFPCLFATLSSHYDFLFTYYPSLPVTPIDSIVFDNWVALNASLALTLFLFPPHLFQVRGGQ